MFFVPGPFGQTIRDVEYPHPVENVAGRFEGIRHIGRMPKIKERGKCKPHPTPLIGNGGSTSGAANLAGQDAFIKALLAIEKMQVIQSSSESDVMFVEDGGPLHGSAMQFLARLAVADLSIHRIRAHLVSNSPTIASRLIFGDERRIIQ